MDVKRVTVTGGKTVFSPVIEGEGGGGEKPRQRRTQKQRVAYRVTGKLDEHGAAIGAPVLQEPVPSKGGASQAPAAPQEIKRISVAPVPSGGAAEPVEAPSSPTTKVLLGGKKPHRVKVLLTKKRHRDEASGGGAKGGEQKVHKPARKIQLGVSAIKKNVTRVNRITRTAKTLPIETIRAELVKAGMIKESSKAPEAVLRQMYADAKTVSSRSL
jgi:hypothetical protein